VLTGLGLVVGSGVAWTGVAWLLARRWPWQQFGDAASQSDVLKLALGVVAAGGAAVALVVNYRRQQHLEHDEAGRRDQLRLFTERFGAAAAQLGGEQAAVRLAGVYAMAALADDWESHRQQCIDVLCGYLRLPYTVEPAPGHPNTVTEQRHYADGTVQRTETTIYRLGEAQVRGAIVETIRQHLQANAEVSWSELTFDFSGAVLVNASFQGAVFSGRLTSFRGTVFSGRLTSFKEAVFSGRLTTFEEAEFCDRLTTFDRAVFSGATGFIGATFSGRLISFDDATFSGQEISFDGATFSSDVTRFVGATFASELTSFDWAVFSGQLTTFDGAEFDSGRTKFESVRFSSDLTRFDMATFTDVAEAMNKADFTKPELVVWGPIRPRPSSAHLVKAT
jgi:uncharacterized protein YjbI with pentapeptide repeats